MNNDKPIDYKFIDPFIEPETREASLDWGLFGFPLLHFSIYAKHTSAPAFVLEATLERIVKSYRTVLNAPAQGVLAWKETNLADLKTREVNQYIASAQKLKQSIVGTHKKNIAEKEAILFNLLFCLFFKGEFENAQKLETFQALVEAHHTIEGKVDLSAYKDCTAAAQCSDQAARKTFAKTRNLHLLELGVLCLNKARDNSQNNIFDFIKYLHLEKGLPFDTKEENTGFVSRYSPAYKILFELESAIEESCRKYSPSSEEWGNPLRQCLQDNQGYLLRNQQAIKVYLEDYLKKYHSIKSQALLETAHALIDKQCPQSSDAVRYVP